MQEQSIQPPPPPEESSPSQSAPPWMPTALALFGFTAIIWTLVRAARKRGGSRGSAPPALSPRERLEKIQRMTRRDSIQRYEADAQELTQRLAAQLDAKAAMLEELLARADARIAQLERLYQETSSPPLRVHEPAPPGHISTGAGGGMDSPVQTSEEPLDASQREIFRLADEGLDPSQIAHRLGQPIGQVRLILALRRA